MASYAARMSELVVAGATPVVTWLELDAAGNEWRIRVAAWNGHAWVIEQTLAPPSGGARSSRLLATAAGDVHLIWQEDLSASESRLVWRRRAAGGAWGAPQIVRTAPSDTRLLLDRGGAAVDPDGAVMLVWPEAPVSASTVPQPETLRGARFEPGSASWAAMETLDSGDRYVASVSPWGHGGWVTVWLGDAPGGRRALRAKRFLGGAWEADSVRVDTEAAEDPYDMALSTAGWGSRVVWTGTLADDSARRGVRSAQLAASAGAWSVPALVSEPSAAQPSRPRLQSQADGGTLAVWGTLSGNGDPWMARADATGAWIRPQRLEADGVFGNGPEVASVGSNGWAVAWARARIDSRQDVVIRRVR
jgi:hypothetical protein